MRKYLTHILSNIFNLFKPISIPVGRLFCFIIFIIFQQILYAVPICHDATGWCYEQSTSQDFYMFYDIRIDDLQIDYTGVISDGEGGYICPSDDCDIVGVFIDDICVGWAYPYYTGGVYTVPVMGDDGSEGTEGYAYIGVIPTFKIWDNDNTVILEAIPINDVEQFLDLNGNCIYDEGDVLYDYGLDGVADTGDEGEGNGILDGGEPIPSWQLNHVPSADEIIDKLNSYFETPSDCNGDAGGSAVIDDCGVCSGGNTCQEANFKSEVISECYGPDLDCACECFGTAVIDVCEQCIGGTTDDSTEIINPPEGWEGDCHFYDGLEGECQDNWALDCSEECFGGRILDEFDECCISDEITMWYWDLDEDLMGDPNSPLDVCYPEPLADQEPPYYTDNTFDLYPNCYSNSVDECGVCDGFNLDLDCAEECFGEAEEDLCGVCDSNSENDNLSCMGCTDIDALNCEDDSDLCDSCEEGIPCTGFYDPNALFYDGSCFFEVWPGDTDVNGFVSAFDIIPIGVFWGEIGSPRPGLDYVWESQTGYDNWSNKWAIFADANGDGIIDIYDVLVIFVNYGMIVESDSYNMSSGSFYDTLDMELYRANFQQIYNGLPNEDSQNPIRSLLEEIYGFETIDYVPQEFKLNQNRPNPFNPVTTIIYEVPSPTTITFTINNILGKTILNFNKTITTPGVYQYEFDGSTLPSGTYFYHLNTASGKTLTRKMMLIK